MLLCLLSASLSFSFASLSLLLLSLFRFSFFSSSLSLRALSPSFSLSLSLALSLCFLRRLTLLSWETLLRQSRKRQKYDEEIKTAYGTYAGGMTTGSVMTYRVKKGGGGGGGAYGGYSLIQSVRGARFRPVVSVETELESSLLFLLLSLSLCPFPENGQAVVKGRASGPAEQEESGSSLLLSLQLADGEKLDRKRKKQISGF